MKFKELREANLTKMQIKKVHDKADDLPKNDFIKRYGKEGDSVRFATATKMVKKELGIEDYEEGFKSDAQRRAAFASGYKEKGKKKNEGGPGSGPRHKEVTLTRNGKTKTVKGVAAKIFTDAGWKVKKEEVELDEASARADAMRAMRRGKKVDPADVDTDATDDDVKAASKNIIMQLRKSVSLRGNFPVEFMDKKKVKVDAKIASAVQDKYNSMRKADDKEKFQAKIAKSYKDMLSALKEGFASDAQRKAAFASGYKEKDKDKKEMMKMNAKHKPGHNEMMTKEGGPGSGPQKDKMKPGAGTRKGSAKDGGQTDKEADDYDSQIAGETYKKEMAMNAMKMNAMKMPIRATYKKEMKTGDDDLSPMNNMKLNAMIKDPHKSKEEDPKRDMNAGYMKSDVRADVKNGGGADMSKVKDAPKMQTAMKKINAMYKTEKYHDTKPGSIQDVVAQMYQTEDKEVTVEDKKLDDMIKSYLTKGGTITKLPPALQKGAKPTAMKKHKVGDKGVIKSMKMKEVREFISTYNLHFLTNYKAEEFILKD